MDRASVKVLVAVEHDRLRSLLIRELRRGGYSPEILGTDGLLEMEPAFGPTGLAVVFLYAGPDPERMHRIAQRLYEGWSERGGVLLLVWHPSSATEQDLFRIWSLDALWRFNSPQQLMTINRSIDEPFRTAIQEFLAFVRHITGERPAQR